MGYYTPYQLRPRCSYNPCWLFVLAVAALFALGESCLRAGTGDEKEIKEYNAQGQLTRMFWVRADGYRFVTNYTAQGKVASWAIEPSTDPKTLLQLAEKEKALQQALDDATSPEDKTLKIKALVSFYIYQQVDAGKATKMVAQLDPSISYGLRCGVVLNIHSGNPADMVKALEALKLLYPDDGSRRDLDFSIKATKNIGGLQ
jgi:hypothetical protein